MTAGTLFEGRYRVERHLGSGGMGAVYQALDERMGRRVALKVLKVHPDAEVHAQHVARFEREARVVSQVRHPNVVTVYDIAVTAGRQPYLVMEYIEGRHLLDLLSLEGGLEPARAVKLLVPALEALARFHAQGIVHRDLKPRNLMIQAPGSEREAMVLLDFGIARWSSSEEAAITKTGQFLGTLQYCAPEYITHKQVSPALDVYHMGLILVEMLSGRPVIPVETDAMAAMGIHLDGALTIAPALLSSPFGEVIRRAVAYDPSQRYAEAGALAEALRALGGRPGLERLNLPRERPWGAEVNPDLQNTADLLRPPIAETAAMEVGPSPSTDPKTAALTFEEDDKTMDIDLGMLARMESVAASHEVDEELLLEEVGALSIESTMDLPGGLPPRPPRVAPPALQVAPVQEAPPAAAPAGSYPGWALWALAGLVGLVLLMLIAAVVGLVVLRQMSEPAPPAAVAPNR